MVRHLRLGAPQNILPPARRYRAGMIGLVVGCVVPTLTRARRTAQPCQILLERLEVRASLLIVLQFLLRSDAGFSSLPALLKRVPATGFWDVLGTVIKIRCVAGVQTLFAERTDRRVPGLKRVLATLMREGRVSPRSRSSASDTCRCCHTEASQAPAILRQPGRAAADSRCEQSFSSAFDPDVSGSPPRGEPAGPVPSVAEVHG